MFALLFAVTGFFLWYGERDTRFRLPSALLVHDWLMYASLVLFLGHLWLALVKPSTRHSMSGITRGWVRADWARRHHAKWVAAIEGGVERGTRAGHSVAAVLIYVAGPLFSEAERAWLDVLAARLRAEGFDCFVPHENFSELKELTPGEVFRVDAAGVRGANVLLAWLDGPVVDDGTACEIGMFAELVASGDPRYRGIVGLVTDLRLQRRRGNAVGDGMNLFVIGAIEANGRVCWSVDDAIDALHELAARRASGSRRAARARPRRRGHRRRASGGRRSPPREQARGQRRPRAARAQRVDRPPAVETRRRRRAHFAIGQLDGAGQLRLRVLARLAHVEQLRFRLGVEQPRELRHGDGLHRLGGGHVDDVADLLEQPDRLQQPRRLGGLVGGARVHDERLVGVEHERRAGGERAAVERDADRAGHVARDEVVHRPRVDHERVAGIVEPARAAAAPRATGRG